MRKEVVDSDAQQIWKVGILLIRVMPSQGLLFLLLLLLFYLFIFFDMLIFLPIQKTG